MHSKDRARGSPGASDGEASGCSRRPAFDRWVREESSGEGNGDPFQLSCLGNGDKQDTNESDTNPDHRLYPLRENN